VGSDTHGQTALVDQNPFVLGTDTRLLNTQPGKLADRFSYLDTFENVANANYNSLEASLTKRLTDNQWLGSSYFTLAYTWGKSIDDASGFRNVNSQVPYYNHAQFRAVSDYDITHRIAFSGGWDLPFNHLWASGPKRLTKGWSLYPIFSWRTGFPMDIFSQLSSSTADPGPSGAGDASLVRANLTTSKVPMFDPRQTRTFTVPTGDKETGSFWFDPTVFNTNYPTGVMTYGTYPRNSLRGPHRTNLDFAVAKKTALVGERLNLEFRAEFFNILNQAEFQLPTLNILDPSFGQISSTYDPRIIQFALKLTF
jgi:hypothetical protein